MEMLPLLAPPVEARIDVIFEDVSCLLIGYACHLNDSLFIQPGGLSDSAFQKKRKGLTGYFFLPSI